MIKNVIAFYAGLRSAHFSLKN